jgi:hypothetical protein
MQKCTPISMCIAKIASNSSCSRGMQNTLEERENVKMDTLPPRCISSTDEGAHLCKSTVAQGLCHLGAPRHAIAHPPTLRQAASAVVLRAARPHRIKLPSRSSVLLVSIMSRSRPRCAALRSLPRCSFARAVSRSPTHLVPRDLALACDLGLPPSSPPPVMWNANACCCWRQPLYHGYVYAVHMRHIKFCTSKMLYLVEVNLIITKTSPGRRLATVRGLSRRVHDTL